MLPWRGVQKVQCSVRVCVKTMALLGLQCCQPLGSEKKLAASHLGNPTHCPFSGEEGRGHTGEGRQCGTASCPPCRCAAKSKSRLG